jgi:hypothetical protein
MQTMFASLAVDLHLICLFSAVSTPQKIHAVNDNFSDAVFDACALQRQAPCHRTGADALQLLREWSILFETDNLQCDPSTQLASTDIS